MAHVTTECEVGEDRVPVPLPQPSVLIDIKNQLSDPSNADVFSSACEQVVLYAHDHPDVVGTSDNMKSLLASLAPDAEALGPASAALAALLLHKGMRQRLRTLRWADRIMACLKVSDGANGAALFLSLLLNVLADPVNKEELTKQARLYPHLVRLLASPNPSVSTKACACANNLCMANPAACVPFSRAGVIPVAVRHLVNLRPGLFAHRVSLLLAELLKIPALEQQIVEAGREAGALRRVSLDEDDVAEGGDKDGGAEEGDGLDDGNGLDKGYRADDVEDEGGEEEGEGTGALDTWPSEASARLDKALSTTTL